MQLQLIVALIAILLTIMFAVQNAVPVSVVFLLWRVDASLAVVIAACFGLGALIGALVSIPAMLRDRISMNHLRKQVATLQTENDDLRAGKK
ncbi:MAG: LapA family protein [Nitrosospira sp.]|nr:LapA family protein [Nitrosospira sp.]